MRIHIILVSFIHTHIAAWFNYAEIDGLENAIEIITVYKLGLTIMVLKNTKMKSYRVSERERARTPFLHLSPRL